MIEHHLNRRAMDEVIKSANLSLMGKDLKTPDVIMGLSELVGRVISTCDVGTMAKAELCSFASNHIIATVKAHLDSTGQGNSGIVLPH